MNCRTEITVDIQLFARKAVFILSEVILDRGKIDSRQVAIEDVPIHKDTHSLFEFDIVFMEIDKHQYPAGFRKAFPRLRKGGLFITDNVLWSGAVVEANPDNTTAGVIEYNRLIYTTPGAVSTILPVRDGVAVTRKE